MSEALARCKVRTCVTPEEVEQYHRDGYLIFGRLLTDDELAEARQQLDLALSELARQGIRPEHMDLPHTYNDYFLKLLSHPRLLDIVEGFIGPNIAVHASHMICKPGGDGKEVPWHQDGEYWPLEPMNVITMWLAFDDADVENGCMRVIPGSHRDGFLPHQNVMDPEKKVLNRIVALGRFSETKAVDVCLKAGECSFHEPWLIHGSNANLSPRRRAGYTIRYMPTSTRLVRDHPRFVHQKDYWPTHPVWLVRGDDPTGNNKYANR